MLAHSIVQYSLVEPHFLWGGEGQDSCHYIKKAWLREVVGTHHARVNHESIVACCDLSPLTRAF